MSLCLEALLSCCCCAFRSIVSIDRLSVGSAMKVNPEQSRPFTAVVALVGANPPFVPAQQYVRITPINQFCDGVKLGPRFALARAPAHVACVAIIKNDAAANAFECRNAAGQPARSTCLATIAACRLQYVVGLAWQFRLRFSCRKDAYSRDNGMFNIVARHAVRVLQCKAAWFPMPLR